MSLYDSQKNKELYSSGVYLKNTDRWEDATGLPRARAMINAIEIAGKLDEISSILDVGCGSGGGIRSISKGGQLPNCAKYVGADISLNAIKIAHEIFPESKSFGVEFTLIDAESAVVEELDDFSLVSMIHVLEHVPDMVEFIESYAKSAKFIYINVPIEFNLNYVVRADILKRLYEKYGHLHFFDEGFIDALLDSNGFEVLSRVYSRDYEGRSSGAAMSFINMLRKTISFLIGPSRANFLLAGFSYGVLVRQR